MSREYLSNFQLKNELKNMLSEVDMFLRDNNLKYTIYGGTLLGAVRHRGFIPWDDDIDLGMVRSEYDRLISILKTENKIGKCLCGIGYELSEGDWPFLKIINPSIYVDEKHSEVSRNLWIDIFPVDAVPNHFEKLYLIYLYYFLRRIFFSKRAEMFGIEYIKSRNPLKRIFNAIIALISKATDTDRIIKKYLSVCKKYSANNNAKRFSENVWGTWQFPREIFEKYTSFKFEDLEVSGIERYDEYLKILYGDYMKMPPENERTSHGVIAWKEDSDE